MIRLNYIKQDTIVDNLAPEKKGKNSRGLRKNN
jgi:hypothetical protein